MILMALDHVRMYFALGTWYADPTDLGTTTPALFFTRWITHFCAPVFFLLAGTSAFLYGEKKDTKTLSSFLLTRGLWLVFAEIVIVNFAWTFDVTYSLILLQVIWALGLSMIALSGLVYLQRNWILIIGLILVFGHNLLDPITLNNLSASSVLWYVLHQPHVLRLGATRVVNVVYPILPWIGVMALGYSLGKFYKREVKPEQRRKIFLSIGVALTLLFILLRGFNLYGEPEVWSPQDSPVFTLMSFLNVTKYPPSLHFLLMTIGPALIFLSATDSIKLQDTNPLLVFGRVPFFFYVIHLYVVHSMAMVLLVNQGREWREYIFSMEGIRSGALINFGLGLDAVYLAWVLIMAVLYPLCRWYQKYKENHPEKFWLTYL